MSIDEEKIGLYPNIAKPPFSTTDFNGNPVEQPDWTRIVRKGADDGGNR